jgi:hypothetical protein
MTRSSFFHGLVWVAAIYLVIAGVVALMVWGRAVSLFLWGLFA